MKKIAMAIFAVSTILVACESKETKDSENTTTTNTTEESKEVIETPKPVVSDAMCYASNTDGNDVEMRLDRSGDNVTGTLNYALKEKDSNKGTISGTMNGDVLIADYTFNAEGTTSVRQVAYQVKDGKATEGYGDMEEKNGKMVFKDPANISFGKGVVLTKVDCK